MTAALAPINWLFRLILGLVVLVANRLWRMLGVELRR